MSRLRKEVLASRHNDGPATAAPAQKSAVRGLAVKDPPRRLGVGQVPIGSRTGGTRSETRSLEVETHDLERQLDSLRIQMAMEKERQQSLV